jgi:hypothetical protein
MGSRGGRVLGNFNGINGILTGRHEYRKGGER